MKILVMSDSHGRIDRVGEVLDKHPSYDAVLFLGDGLRDVAYIDGVVSVRGNCDPMLIGERAVNEQMLTLDGFKILMMHGHLHSVKSGLADAVNYALSKNADILLYGHTHVCKERYIPEGSVIGGQRTQRPIYVFNPGSLYGYEASYGIIEIKNGSVLFSHGTV